MTFAIAALWLFLCSAASAGAAVPVTWTTSPLSGPLEDVPVRNYGIVEQGLLSRSGKLTTDGYAWLRQRGVKGIVDFTDGDVDESFLKELGFMSYFRLPLPLKGPPSDAQADQFLAFVQDSRNWPLHVHCRAGKDRTGVMVALVRYALDGWPFEKALEEAKLYRRGKDLSPTHVKWLKRWARSHPPGSYRPVSDGDTRKDGAR